MIKFNKKYVPFSTAIRNSASCVTTRDVTVSFSMRKNSLRESIYPKDILQVAQQDFKMHEEEIKYLIFFKYLF